jgi:hypothetical protein
MQVEQAVRPQGVADWLFSIGSGKKPSQVDGLVLTEDFNPSNFDPSSVEVMEKALSYGARAVLFEAGQNGKPPTAQALIFEWTSDSEQDFAEMHRRLWSWGKVPLVYRAGPASIELFRCAAGPDFVKGQRLIVNPVKVLEIAASIASQESWWDAKCIRNGTIWDSAETCELMLAGEKAAHRKLVDEVHALFQRLTSKDLLAPTLRRRLLILSLLIAYLEERSVLTANDFSQALEGATRFFEVLGNGTALVKLLQAMEVRFNGNVFSLTDEERAILTESTQLADYARFVEGIEESTGQLNLWKRYSFRDLPVELISNVYQLFVDDKSSSIYTPPALVRLILEEVLGWERLDRVIYSGGVLMDPACGSGIFLVEAYRRLVLHWRLRNDWARPNLDVLRSLLDRLYGVDIEQGAIELAGFSLCLALCDALEPNDIRASVHLFPRLSDKTLHHSCFFQAIEQGIITAKIDVVVGNPPFSSTLQTEAARRSYQEFIKTHGSMPDKQLAYLFLFRSAEMLSDGGILAMVEPAGFLYNHKTKNFRDVIFDRWNVREILDFISIRGIFDADTKVVVPIIEATNLLKRNKILHAIFRRNGRAKAAQGFDIDYYDLHWIDYALARCSVDVWKANLLGGRRVLDFITRLRKYPTLGDFAEKAGWVHGEGYLGGQKNASDNVQHLIGKPFLPTNALGASGIEAHRIELVPDSPIKDPKSESSFMAPLLLIKEHENLHSGLWTKGYLVFRNEIVGFSAPGDLRRLKEAHAWIQRELTVLQAYVAGVSARLFSQKATAIFSLDVHSLPFPVDGNLDISHNERIIVEDITDFQRDFIRLGGESKVMQPVPDEALAKFDGVLTAQINAIYSRRPLHALGAYRWPGVVCTAFAFGDGIVEWSNADELQGRLDALLQQRRSSSLTVTRVMRLYDEGFIFLLKPAVHRFWTRSVALRDADEILADLRSQGF